PVGRVVAHVDLVVGPVGAEPDGADGPAPEAGLALLGELAVEAEGAPAHHVVRALELAHAVDVDLERRADLGGQVDDRAGHQGSARGAPSSAATAAAKASTSPGVVSHEHIQRTSPVPSSHV